MNYTPYLDWIDQQHEAMCQLVWEWSHINSGSWNLEGLAQMSKVLQTAFVRLGADMHEVDLPPKEVVNSQGEVEHVPLGKALHLRKRPEAPLKVMLVGHMDTVFGKTHPFQTIHKVDDNTWNGPGVADLKGGLAVMLKALEAFERTPYTANLGWEIVINPDEEISSDGSGPLLAEVAGRSHLGLIYEPATNDQGQLAGERKGVGSFSVVVHGKSAHVGRAFESGRNAICALAEFLLAANQLNEQRETITLNVGRIEGGGPLNMVPDLAIGRINVRTESEADEKWVQHALQQLQNQLDLKDGIRSHLYGKFSRKPKRFTPSMSRLFDLVAECGTMLSQPISWKATGGACDGNNLAAAGLPNVDTLGVRGGKIHSAQEYLLLDSLTERAKLSALLLMRLASGEVKWENP